MSDDAQENDKEYTIDLSNIDKWTTLTTEALSNMASSNTYTGSTTFSGYAPGYGATPSTVTITAPSTSYAPSTMTVGGGGSGTGYVYTSTGTGPVFSNPNHHTNISISGPSPTISTDKNKINLDELADTISVLRERLLILIPNFEKHEKYQALKKAYDHYKMIEALIQEEHKDV